MLPSAATADLANHTGMIATAFDPAGFVSAGFVPGWRAMP